MKILAIGRNYVEHIEELNNERPDEPIIFTKPDTALVRNNQPFYYPDFSNDIHFEAELVLKICRNGRHIEEQFAHKYYDEIGIGIDLTARDLQNECKQNGLPWEIAKGFDQSAPIGQFLSVSDFKNKGNIRFSLIINGETRQEGNSSDMIFSFDQIIAYISKFITLRIGDMIFTGTPKGVGPVQKDDHFEAFIENKKLLEFDIK